MSRPGFSSTREALIDLMDQDIFITPTQAQKYGLVDEVIGTEEEMEHGPRSFVAAAGHRIRLTETMRHRYQDHLAEERKQRDEAVRRALAKARALTNF